MKSIIEVKNISKQYRLGIVGTGSLNHDINRWWQKVRGKEDPYLKIGESNDRSTKGGSEYVWALRDINFSVQPGEVLGIIGRNGAGKSTLLKILSRITKPTTGSIKLRGRVASLLEVGTGMHPDLTGRENIYLHGAILGMRKKEIDIKFDEIVDFAGVTRYIDTPVKRYSTGMHVRLGFAVAAHLEPEILIVDEVLAVGDLEFQQKCLGKMKDVSQHQGRTVLFVSHNLSAVRELCPRALLLENGTLIMDNEVNEVVSHYHSSGKAQVSFTGEPKRSKGYFTKIRLVNRAGEILNTVSIDEEVWIQLAYTLTEPVAGFNVGFNLKDGFGYHIYASADTDTKPLLYVARQPGHYKATIPLPISHFNAGNYSIEFLMGEMNRDVFDKVEIVFSIQNEQYFSGGERPGLLMQTLDWETKLQA